MRALVWHGPRSLTLEHVPEPAPGPGEVLLRVEAVGICGSEVLGYVGHSSLRKPPLIMGHEFSGTVERAPRDGRLARGQRVIVNPLVSCGECPLCRTGQTNLCLRRALIGAHRPGAFAEFVAVPERNCHPLPEGLDPTLAAVAEPLACGVRAVEVARVTLGESVCVLGSGMIGLCAVAAARRAGAVTLAATDTHPVRLEAARAWGATHLLDARGDVVAAVRHLTGSLGVDVAVDAVGLGATRRAAVACVRPGGRVVLVGLHEAESTFQANDIVRSETQVLGSFAYRLETFERAVGLLERGMIDGRGGWLEERPLEGAPDAFEELLSGRVSAAKVLLKP
jgi:threonine dehydrogenase-like Zn-dependent dehydrogenase